MAVKTPDKNQRQKQALTRIVIMACILVCINVLASYFHSGMDLTREKRFTLSPSTKTLLTNMPEVAVVDVYLKGKFPPGLQRLQEAVRERLRSFKDIAGNKVIFRFSDPFEGKDAEQQKQVVHDLENKGIHVLQLNTQDDEEYSSKPFFPYALVHYNGHEMAIMLLEDKPGRNAMEKITDAEAMLEYKFANAIVQLSKPQRSRVAYVVGNDEDLGIKTIDMLSAIPRYYDLDTVDLMHIIHIPLAYDAIIINQPKVPFTGPEKLRIDQYVMHGGHVLWAVNTLNASIDSLANSPQFIAMELGLNLDDILFKYGVRVNNDLVEDMDNMQLPRFEQASGRTEKLPWVYFPKLNPVSQHPIVRNMDFIFGRFTNTIDTIAASGINKTVLLQTSKYSRKANAPVRVSLSMMNYKLQETMFTKSYLPVAMLLEGKFHSVYQNRLAPEYLRFLDSVKETFKPVCDSDNSMIVVSVGDIFTNDYTAKEGIVPMGYYKFDGQSYANRSFLLNCLQYLTDKSGVLETRSKQVKLRLLDLGRAKDEKTKWQAINVSIPIAIVLVFASCYLFFRKRRYETSSNAEKPRS